MSSRDEKAAKRFGCSERERALFEAGIKMGTIYHQFVGTPVSAYNAAELEKAIEMSVMVQPFVESVKIKINLPAKEKKDTYDYVSLTGDMMDAVVVIRIEDVSVTAEMRYDTELDYPLMYVSEVSL
ncbi:MAG: dihydroneopterin aldolase family protein [Methanomassiliicoccaceae archaeon]|jgi:hypothetical protein|nr:dihydroneopterin aldolase family protein [Methanomassiliicoccaceae archaeon]